ncbi:MAG: methyltransferase domain-containing protein [Methylophaga sp.]|nr:methyltransferase domain-containing protein [Methylophaga sp.]
MKNIDTKVVDKHYGSGGIMDKIEAGLRQAGKDFNLLTVDDLAPVDGFHTRGRLSTIEVAELADIKTTDLILDVGCGLGGTPRYLASQYQCNVTGIDLTEEYITAGKQLSKLVNMHDKVTLHHASALELPFDNNSFDIVWTEHVQMNIADKTKFYSEIVRVLKPSGRLLFHDVFRGYGDDPIYPVPWAENKSISALVKEKDARLMMEAAGFDVEQWHTKTHESIEFFKQVAVKIKTDGPPPLGIHILMGDNAKEKLKNQAQNLNEGRVSIALGMARKV